MINKDWFNKLSKELFNIDNKQNNKKFIIKKDSENYDSIKIFIKKLTTKKRGLNDK